MQKSHVYKSVILYLSLFCLVGCSKETEESDTSVKQSTEIVSQKESEHTTEDSSGEATEKGTQVNVTEEASAEEQTETESEEAGDLNYGTVKRSGNTDPKRKYFAYSDEHFIYTEEDRVFGSIELPERLKDTPVWDEILDQVVEEYQRLECKESDYQGADIMLRKKMNVTSDIYVGSPNFDDPSTGFNHTVSFRFSRYYKLDTGIEPVGAEYSYKVYSLETGKELHLRDFFYEDTDYVTLLNHYIGGKYSADSEDSCLFRGITPDQDFYFDSNGNIYFVIDGSLKTIRMSYRDFAEISAISEFVEEQELNYMPMYSDPRGFSGKQEERASYHGIEGISENVLISYPKGTPEPILEFIQNGYLDSCSCLHEGLLADYHRANPDEKLSVHTDARVDRLGPFYLVNRDQVVYQYHFEGGYNEQLYNFNDWENINNKTILFDPDGNQITWNQMFSDPEQVYSLIADELAENNVTDAEITGNIPNFDGFFDGRYLQIIYSWEKLLDYSGEGSINIPCEDLYPYFDDSFFR